MILNAVMTAVVFLSGIVLFPIHILAGMGAAGMLYFGLGAESPNPPPAEVFRGYIGFVCAVLCLIGGIIVPAFKRIAMSCFVSAGVFMSAALIPVAFPNGLDTIGVRYYIGTNAFLGFLPHSVLAALSHLLWRRTRARKLVDKAS